MRTRRRPAPMEQLTHLPVARPVKVRTCPHCGEPLSPRMTPTEQLDAINRYIAGDTLNALADRFGRDVTTIRRLMKRNNIRKLNRKPKGN